MFPMIVDKLQWFCALRVVLQSVLVHPRKRLRCSLYYAAAGKVFNSPVASRYIHRRLIILLLLTASMPSVNCIGAKVLCRWQPLSRARSFEICLCPQTIQSWVRRTAPTRLIKTATALAGLRVAQWTAAQHARLKNLVAP